MCYNCGCHMKDDDMGDPDNITQETFEKAAKAWGQTVEEAKINTFKMLRREVGQATDPVQSSEHNHAGDHTHE